MAKDHRMLGPRGERLPFSCENAGYKTDIERGFTHGPMSSTRGNVLETALIHRDDEYSLWLEHVVEKETRERVYWLMWYDSEGKPTIPMSGIFAKTNLEKMVGKLISFVP